MNEVNLLGKEVAFIIHRGGKRRIGSGIEIIGKVIYVGLDANKEEWVKIDCNGLIYYELTNYLKITSNNY